MTDQNEYTLTRPTAVTTELLLNNIIVLLPAITALKASIDAGAGGGATDVTLASVLAALSNKALDSTVSGVTAALTGKSTEATLLALKASVDSLVAALPVKAATVTQLTPTNVALLSVVVAPANANRKGFIAWNNSSNSAYLSLAGTSVAASCTQIVLTFANWQLLTPICYTGAISAIRNAGTGNVVVWEFT